MARSIRPKNHLEPLGSEAASPSRVEVENDFVSEVYEKLSHVYDLVYGPPLQPGRLQALERMQLRPGDRVLEVGVGTGINLVLYPRTCSVTGIDFSSAMLEKARERVAKRGMQNVRLLEMDAADLKLPDDSFDVVYAPYLISVVPEPVKVAREMFRVCRPGGKILILNHFKSENPLLSKLERAISPMTVHIGFKSDLDLGLFLKQADLRPAAIEKVNFPKLWSLVICVKG